MCLIITYNSIGCYDDYTFKEVKWIEYRVILIYGDNVVKKCKKQQDNSTGKMLAAQPDVWVGSS